MKTLFFKFVLFLFAGILHFGCNDNHEESHAEIYHLTRREMSMLQEGDIILRYGYGMVSRMIVETLDEEVPVSHVGILINNKNGGLDVIHSVSGSLSGFDGVQMESLEKFVRDSRPHTIVISRYNGTKDSPDHISSIRERALHYLKLKIGFDHAFDFNTRDRKFCTELIFDIFDDVFGKQFTENVYPDTNNIKDRLKMQYFMDDRYFQIIINHHLKSSENQRATL